MGKTALAIRAAGAVAGSFPGGINYVDGRSHDVASMVSDAMRGSSNAVLIVDDAEGLRRHRLRSPARRS